MIRTDVVIAVLVAFCLTAMLFMIMPVGSEGLYPYDPWWDLTDDGKIDIGDIARISATFGTFGPPTKHVNVASYSWSNQSYQVTVPPQSFGSLNITTAGYKQLTVGLASNCSLKTSTAFLISTRYATMDAYDIVKTAEPPINRHEANAMWIEPGQIDLSGVQYHERFNVTVWLNVTSPTNAWQFYLTYNGAHLTATNCGYTGNGKSLWSGALPTDNVSTSYGYHNATYNRVLVGEVLKSSAEVTGAGSLSWVEFELLNQSSEGELRLDVIGAYNSIALDNTFQNISPALHFEKSAYGNFANYFDIATFDFVRTYPVTGQLLTIYYYNPNNFDATLTVEAYLTN